MILQLATTRGLRMVAAVLLIAVIVAVIQVPVTATDGTSIGFCAILVGVWALLGLTKVVKVAITPAPITLKTPGKVIEL